jgi:hypothetical protein
MNTNTAQPKPLTLSGDVLMKGDRRFKDAEACRVNSHLISGIVMAVEMTHWMSYAVQCREHSGGIQNMNVALAANMLLFLGIIIH